MLARDLSDFLTLEEPTGPDALEAGTQLAKVLTLGASVLDLDPRAGQGIEFLTERIREAFTIPALSTNSKEALVALWSEVGASVLRRMDAIAELLHEAALASGSDAINQRLEHGDQAAISELALKFADERSSATGKRLRRTSVLISDARARLRELGKQIDDVDLRLLGAFRRAVLMWAVGIGLCFEIAERKSGLVEEDFRPGLLDDAVEIVTSSARLAGYYAATSARRQSRRPPAAADQ